MPFGTVGYSVANTEGTSLSVGTTEAYTVGDWVETSNAEEDRTQKNEYEEDISTSESKAWTGYSVGTSTEVEVGAEVGAAVTLAGPAAYAKVYGSVKNTVATGAYADNYLGHTNTTRAGAEMITEKILGTSTSHGSKQESTFSTTITRTNYHETTVTNSNEIATGQKWVNATTIDTGNAGKLRFRFWIKNTGSDIAREINDLRFSIRIGDNIPITIPPIGEPGYSKENLIPGDTKEFSVDAQITLDELREIDEGKPIRITVADYSYGVDELFFESAWGTDVLVEIDDGIEDGDESIDYYMTYVNYGETYLDVLKRLNLEVPIGHPLNTRTEIELTVDDANDILSIVDNSVTEWSWWNIYIQDLEGTSDRFADQPATKKSRLSLVYYQDSDHDYYTDRTELKIGTDPEDFNSHPSPVLIIGKIIDDSDPNKIIRLKFTNAGNYDAYGIEAILYSPDNTTTVIDSLIGGGGRIEAGRTFEPNETLVFSVNDVNYTEPEVLVRYNDPQGPHTFITQVKLEAPNSPVDEYVDEMLPTSLTVICNSEFCYYRDNKLVIDYLNSGSGILDANIVVAFQDPNGVIYHEEERTVNIRQGISSSIFSWKPVNHLADEWIGEKFKVVVIISDYQGIEIAADVVKFDIVEHPVDMLTNTFSDGTTSKILEFDVASSQQVYLRLPKDAVVADARLQLEIFHPNDINDGDIWLEVGEIDEIPEWAIDQTDSHVYESVIGGLAPSINFALDSGNCDCNGCGLDGRWCLIPLTIHSTSSGTVEISNLRIFYEPTECDAANIDGDNPIDFKDFCILADHYLETGSFLAGDLDEDEKVCLIDFSSLAAYWGSDCNHSQIVTLANDGPLITNLKIIRNEISWQVHDSSGIGTCRLLINSEESFFDEGDCLKTSLDYSRGPFGVSTLPSLLIVAYDCDPVSPAISFLEYVVRPKANLVFVTIPEGTFEMGRHSEIGNANERPIHTVSLSSFMISKYEVTNAQYVEFLNTANNHGLIKVVDDVVYASSDSNDSFPYCDTVSNNDQSQISYSNDTFEVRSRDGYSMADHPMLLVSWFGAKAFCDYYGYRLPTEAEWEYAARGGYHDPYYQYAWGSDVIDCNMANYYSDSPCNPITLSNPPYTTPVDYYPNFGYGLHDMAGNAWEWCNDWHDSLYYDWCKNICGEPCPNPIGPPDGTLRVVRGGSWGSIGDSARVAFRGGHYPDRPHTNGGFRPVLDMK